MTTDFNNVREAEDALDAFEPAERAEALAWLARNALPAAPRISGGGAGINLHIHSFFSFNAMGFSPSHIAWEARKAGLMAAGLCDFDVLDGQEEFLNAALRLGLRATVAVETRAFVREYRSADINSPGEPGVAYALGAGFARPLPADMLEDRILKQYRRQARERNLALIGRINAKLPEISIHYEEDVVPLTPAGCATERHIVCAYRENAEAVFGRGSERCRQFWMKHLGKTVEQVGELCLNLPAFEEVIRAALVKRGGLGYEAPTEKTFPPVEDFFAWVRACGALPMIGWLDGASPGEARTETLIEFMMGKGGCALNLIPDRNHNIADPEKRAVKVKKLEEIVRAAVRAELPIVIGTELNKEGQPFADDLNAEALRPHREAFLRGARIMTGHTWLSRYAGFSYVGEAATAEFGADTDTARKNAFFEAVGSLPPLTLDAARRLEDMGGEKALACFRESAAQQRWTMGSDS